VEALTALDPTDAERAAARTALLDTLAKGYTDGFREVVEALTALDPTDAERAAARTALLDTLAKGYTDGFYDVVEALTALDPTDAERAAARTALHHTLATVEDTWRVVVLVAALRGVSPVQSWLVWLAQGEQRGPV